MLHEKLSTLLDPRSPRTNISALVEIKPGVGGSESSLFLSDLLRMYSRYATLRGWTAKIISSEDKEGGGLKNAILEIDGEGAYDCLQWESGVHRVQRVPKTEASGRVHTSTVQVLVRSPRLLHPLSMDSCPLAFRSYLIPKKLLMWTQMETFWMRMMSELK